MKKLLVFTVAAITLASCSKELDMSNAPQAPTRSEKYNSAFEATFGTINSAVNWGFNAVRVIDIDETGAAVTRGNNVNRNEWGTGNGVGGNVVVPKNLNDPTVNANEQTLVYNYFNKERRNYTSAQVNWTDFFITEVWKGEKEYDNVLGQNVGKGSDMMNHLQVRKGEGYVDSYGNLQGDWEHANDFNNGDHNSKWETIEGHTFMNNSGTLEFAYHNTKDSKYHNEYIIIPGAEIDPSLAGYWYVGFDFYSHQTDIYPANIGNDVERDYVYTDWIVRISPGQYINAQRVMVEDLIATSLSNVDKSDWDFNDAVFDVAFSNEWIGDLNDNRLVAHITLYAAGGTMPLYIAGQEVHALLGQETDVMINTGATTGKHVDGVAPVQFTAIIGAADYSNSTTADAVSVSVVNGDNTYVLAAEEGEAPQKIITSTATRWMKERKLITLGYAEFANYVNNNAPTNWYNTVTDASVLY